MQESEEKKIALELLETEQAYVNRLHLLDQVSWGVWRYQCKRILERVKLLK